MSSASNAKALAQDPTNSAVLALQHAPPQRRGDPRLDPQPSAVTLNLKIGGPSIYPPLDEAVLATSSTKGGKWGNSSPEELGRRSIYIKIKRSAHPPEFASFDFADTDAPCPVRFTTTVPTQALEMLNSRFLNDQASTMAANLREQAGDDPAAQVRFGLQIAFSRKAQQDEAGSLPSIDRKTEIRARAQRGEGAGALLPAGAEPERIHLPGLDRSTEQITTKKHLLRQHSPRVPRQRRRRIHLDRTRRHARR